MDKLVSNIIRFSCRCVLLSVVALPVAQNALAQTPVQTPDSVVLVLKLVSATHVRPTTGIVISNDGLVIVPAAFVSEGDEIVVMDGGTDILSHARPARTIKRSSVDGLAVLSVDGLKRPAIRLSQKAMVADSVLHFAAFPPAEEMAEGAPPLWIPVKTILNGTNSQIELSAESPLPNVSGAIVDNCGQLAGLNLAQGAQSLETDKQPTRIIGDALNHVLNSMQISLLPGNCNVANQSSKDVPATTNTSEENLAEPDEQEIPNKETAVAVVEPDVSVDKESPAASTSRNTNQINTKTVAVAVTTTPSLIKLIPIWLWLVGLLILVALIIKGVMLLRIGSTPAVLASDEPDTANLRAGTDISRLKSTMADGEIPDLNSLPVGSDGIVLLEGLPDDDGQFKRFCMISSSHIDLIIGRGDADIAIEFQSISRRHVRLQGDGTTMTLSDLGSSNGTFIRDIPCLPGEIMYIEPQDDILLGDVCFRISVLTRDDNLT